MKLTINRNCLLKTLNIVSVAIGQKSPTPAFLNFKLVMDDEKLTVTGSNSELTICSYINIRDGETVNIQYYEKGATLITSKYLLEIIRRLDSELVTIEIIDEVIAKISDEKSDFKLNSMRIEEYPELDLSIEGDSITFNAVEFKTIISQTSFAASNKEIRPILTAVNLKASENEIDFVATDSYRLSKKIVNISSEEEFEANIPVKTLQEVAKMVDDREIILTLSSRKAVFQFGETILFSRLIIGDFPKTSKMIPETYPYVLQISSEAFISAINRVSLLAIERENIVKISISNDRIDISSKTDQVGSANEIITNFRYSGDRFDISFNVNYVIDAIKACQSDDVIISFAGEMSAFRVTAPNDTSIVQIVTPVRSYY